MTIKQAFDEVNATDEQKKNGLDRLLQSDKKRSFIPQIKRYVAAAAAVVVAAGTAGVGIHFAVINNQGGPINVSIGDNSAADSVITPSENTKVHSEKSGMTFIDDKAFWAQLGRITYFPVDITTAVNTEIYAADDFDTIVPHGGTVLQTGDLLVMAARAFEDRENLSLQEVVVERSHKWCGRSLSEISVPRNCLIVMIKRGLDTIIPDGSTRLEAGDVLVAAQSNTAASA